MLTGETLAGEMLADRLEITLEVTSGRSGSGRGETGVYDGKRQRTENARKEGRKDGSTLGKGNSSARDVRRSAAQDNNCHRFCGFHNFNKTLLQNFMKMRKTMSIFYPQ